MFVAKNSVVTSRHELLHLFGPFCIEFRKATKQSRMHPNSTNATIVSLGSHGVDRVPPLRKNPTRLRGTNFCTSSARFAPSFIRQPNGPECTQIVQNAQKRQFRVQWGGSGVFVAKKIRRDFVARTFALVRPVLDLVSCGNQTVPNAPK